MGRGTNLSSKENSAVKLSRQVNLIDCISLTVGVVIGSGIFISPASVLAYSGGVGWSLVVWVACGLISMIGALCYAELGTTFAVSGGDFSYLLQAFGPIPAFLRLWTSIVSIRTGVAAVLCMTCSNYLLRLVYTDCDVPQPILKTVAAVFLCTIFSINSVSVPFSRQIQVIFTVAKLLGLLVIIIFGLIELSKGNTSSFNDLFTTTDINLKDFPLAIYSGLFAYSGWQFLPQVTEEIINPSRNIPLSIISSMIIIMVVYILTNVAYLAVLSPAEILSSSAVALDLGQRVLGDWWWTMSIAVALSCIGSVNGSVFQTARVLLVSSREGHMPAIVSMIHIDKKTPLPAAALLLPICLLMLVSDDVSSLINFLSFTRWLFIGITCAIIPYYRWKFPNLERPFKVPVILPIIFVGCSFFVVAMSLYSSPVNCGIGLGIMLCGLPVYYLCVWWKNKPSWINNGIDDLTIFLQQLLYVVPEET